MTEYTKGPWHIGKAASDVAIYGPKGEHVATLPGMLMHNEVLANAALLIAAPELLAAIEVLMRLDIKGHQLQDRLQFSDSGRAVLAQCSAAIAKAKGA